MDMWWLPALIVSNLALLLNAAIIFKVGDIFHPCSVVHVLSVLIHTDQALPTKSCPWGNFAPQHSVLVKIWGLESNFFGDTLYAVWPIFQTGLFL